MTEPKLKPCPFCGASGLDVFMYEDGETDGNYVLCERCGASIGLAFEPLTEKEAIEAWNKRVSCDTCAMYFPNDGCMAGLAEGEVAE